MSLPTTRKGQIVQDPPFIQKLFSDTRMSIFWLILRVYAGYQWIEAGSHKITNPAWMSTGAALKGYWANAVKIADPAHPTIAFGWYRTFIQMLLDTNSYVWFAKLVSVGELLVGIALVLGLFTGVAAFFGGLMNWNYIMAGSASTNGLLLVIAVALVAAWKIAGFIGLDYFLIKYMGTPWQTSSEKATAIMADASATD